MNENKLESVVTSRWNIKPSVNMLFTNSQNYFLIGII